MTCSAADVIAGVHAAAATVTSSRDELTELDRQIGDADHGENLDRGFKAVVSALSNSSVDTPAGVLKLVASTLISSVGGAAGPLYGTGFLRAASVVGDAAELEASTVAAALRAGLEGVAARGKAVVGDKTMIDALSPAADAAEQAAQAGASAADVLRKAAQAAEDAAAGTEPLVARKGRASYLGDRSAGHVDPGARSTALLLGAFADAARAGGGA